MSKANFTILKQCENCGEMFEAQRRTTRFCSHKCNSQNYKLRKRLEVKKEIESNPHKKALTKYKTKAIDLELIKSKEFITVKELSFLLGCGKDTIYRMIKNNEIKAINLSKKLTRIRRKDIEGLFDNTSNKEQVKPLTVENCYTMVQIVDKYKVSRSTIYNNVGKHNIKRIKKGGITYYYKNDIDNLFLV